LIPRYIQDNNIAELEAASEAIAIALRLGIQHLTIVTDSEHVVKCHEKLKGDALKLLIFKQTLIYKKYEYFYKRFDRLVSNKIILIEFKQVKGHNGLYCNEEADQ
jgi:ribonuclease HI